MHRVAPVHHNSQCALRRVHELTQVANGGFKKIGVILKPPKAGIAPVAQSATHNAGPVAMIENQLDDSVADSALATLLPNQLLSDFAPVTASTMINPCGLSLTPTIQAIHLAPLARLPCVVPVRGQSEAFKRQKLIALFAYSCVCHGPRVVRTRSHTRTAGPREGTSIQPDTFVFLSIAIAGVSESLPHSGDCEDADDHRTG